MIENKHSLKIFASDKNVPNIANKLNLSVDSVSLNKSSFFISNSIQYLLSKLNKKDYRDALERNNLVLDVIRLKQPISKYELAKITGLSYPTIKTLIKNFEFVNLLKTTIAEGDNGLPVKLISIKDSKEKKEKTPYPEQISSGVCSDQLKEDNPQGGLNA